MPRVWKILLVVVATLGIVATTVAQADVVQQVSFQLQNIKPDGRFTLLFSAHTFDTTGAVPPQPTESYLRLPVGATLRKEFLNKSYFCDGKALRDALDRDLLDSGTPFTKRVADLRPFIKRLSKSKSPVDRRALANAEACQRGRLGSGTAQIDARDAIKALTDPLPAKFSMFLSRPAIKGGIAGFTVIGAADESSPIVKRTPIVANVHTVLNATFLNDPTPDGLYGYKLELPVGPVNGFSVSIAELSVTTTGLTILKGTCLKQGKHGTCVKKQKQTIFWFTKPKCPPSGQISIQSFYAYAPPQPNITKTVPIACPKFG